MFIGCNCAASVIQTCTDCLTGGTAKRGQRLARPSAVPKSKVAQFCDLLPLLIGRVFLASSCILICSSHNYFFFHLLFLLPILFYFAFSLFSSFLYVPLFRVYFDNFCLSFTILIFFLSSGVLSPFLFPTSSFLCFHSVVFS